MRVICVGAFLALAGCVSETTTPTPVGVGQPSGSMQDLLNAARAQNGLGPLREDARLSRSAKAHAQDMAANDFFGHVSSDGRSFDQRADAAGYSCARAENIAWGQRSEAAVMDAWMKSPGHRTNIMRDNVTEFGIGRSGDIWVQVFGRGGC